MWLGTMCFVRLNQKADIWVSTRPFSGIGVGKTTSKAERRSVVTMSRLDPRSKISRTLPRDISFSPGISALIRVSVVMVMFGSFPLDGGRRLRRDVVDDPIDAPHF